MPQARSILGEPKLHSNVVPEAEFRSRILCAIAVLTIEHRPITFSTMRSAGFRGDEKRVRQTVEALRQEGLIAPHVLSAAQGVVLDPIDELAAADLARRRTAEDMQQSAREQSVAWVAEHDARWRRIRQIGEPRRAKK
jgi:hypothetical protein